MERFVKPGDFCPYADCGEYGKKQDERQKNIRKYGKTKRGVQRYQCCACQRTFTATTGTIFYEKHTSEAEILEVLALLAEGSRISSLSRVKGYKEDTILCWLRDAREHLEAVEELLLKNYRVTRGQLDALWGYVGNKGQKKLPGNG
jgi:transposase-like protein